MKKIMLSLLTISLIGTTVMPVYAADVYGEETTNLYSYNEGAMYDDDHVKEYSADVEEEKLQKDFEAAMQDENIKLSEDGIETMNLISTGDYNIDTEYAVEVNDYKSKPILDV
jgi:hypothetical protein